MTDAENVKATLQRELDSLKRTRDELRVQLHLAAADAKDEFDKLETKWARVEAELGRMGSHAKEPLEDIARGARGLADELKKGYSRIREQLKRS
jgi:predicted  nucleic acid-binding Zn-ribbon protein